MFKNLLYLEGAYSLSKSEQKLISGGDFITHEGDPNCQTTEKVNDGCSCNKYVGCINANSSCIDGVCKPN